MKQNTEIFGNVTQISWELNESGVLSLHGQGEVSHYDCGERKPAPWADVKEQIKEVIIAEGITSIGRHAFRVCENLQRVVLPETLEKIHSYAFYDCKQLECIESKRKDFRYIYDERPHKYFIDAQMRKKCDTIVFGIHSFFNVPWSREKWGDFYCSKDVLYATFTNTNEEKKLVIPEGIRLLKTFSLSYLNVDSIVFPKSLEKIEEFAFYGSKIKKELLFFDNVKTIHTYAFADSEILQISMPWRKKKDRVSWKRVKAQTQFRKKYPQSIPRYSLRAVRREEYGEFGKLQIVERKEIHHKDGSVTKVRDNQKIDVGMNIYQRIQKGNVPICICHENGKVVSVKSFAWTCHGIPSEYLMYPIRTKDGSVEIWRDSFTYQEKDDIVYAFWDTDAKKLKEAEVLRFRHPDTHEEWFQSKEREDFGGSAELELLERWLKLHPEIEVETMEENVESDATRWFVDV